MSLTGAKPASKTKRLEANNLADFGAGFEGCIDVLRQEGLDGVDGEPDVVIILRHNGSLQGRDKLVDATVYIDATAEEISNDLTQKKP